ncbi:hypothetical protein SmJEL517_g01105 [Synchytrium microbalum]|uniref:L-2-hydroxyglutarate dehydrogenase, mitochondrial n=1 Tax=Synchytrium microbalum TaxID=1806994 RepID=A0A507C6M8_9FUNG|nr:uncharacterized protein SmJEL517_g01105 [Synchytrium microbalum]TPX37240.1 hypothetical protein SmJEL517_g01105 [Synchytrium microbalum]
MQATRAIGRLTLVHQSRNLATVALDPDFTVDHVVIGAGVVGLAVAERLSRRPNTSTLVLERHAQFGYETSSRNSEVIHAGIYYPPTSLKTKLCIRGRELMYQTCADARIPFKKMGKWMVAVESEESEYLHQMKDKADKLGVPTTWLTRQQIVDGEPNLVAKEVLFSPETGVLDSHAFMEYLEARLKNQEGDIIYRHPVESISSARGGGYLIRVGGPTPSLIKTRILVNSAGLYSDRIAAFLLPEHYGPGTANQIRYTKGHYYGLRGSSTLVHRLIYPCPEKQARENVTYLGVHCTLDLTGRLRFGPDALYVDRPDDYKVNDADEVYLTGFHAAIKRYLPSVRKDDLYPDYTGIRPKLSGYGEPFRDFVIKEESDRGFPGFLNLVGIESPGLTSSLAIAEHIETQLL